MRNIFNSRAVKRGKILMIVLCLSSFYLASCTDSGEKASISVSAESVEIPAEGGSKTISVTSTVSWTASVTSGFTVSPTSGDAGTTAVTISAEANTSSAKTGTLTISGGVTVTVSITQPAIDLSVEPSVLTLESGSVSGTITISCSGQWSISTVNQPDWITNINPVSGTGNAVVTISTSKSTSRLEQSYILAVTSGSSSVAVVIRKTGITNTPPTAPTNLSPTGSSGLVPLYTWTASTDEDGDEITYTVKYSKDQSTWSDISAGTTTYAVAPEALSSNTTYYWKVLADDGYSGGVTESEVVSFTTTSETGYYTDGAYRIYQESKYSNAVTLVFSGDGFTSDMFTYDTGLFDQYVNRAIEGFFDIEPFRTYRDYFTVYKIAAYSNETGISIGSSYESPTTKKDTRFQCTWAGGNSTAIDINLNVVVEYWKKIPGLTTDAAQTYAPFCIISNSTYYAGTNITFWSNSGTNGYGGLFYKSACTVTMSDSYVPMENVVMHEYGGHGFGLLVDEYSYTSQGSIPSSASTQLTQMRSKGPLGYGWNVSLVDGIENTPWAQFKDYDRYVVDESLGCYLGGYTYVGGVWRPSQNGCMNQTKDYHNVQGRWLIYKRIMETIGKEATLSDFMEHDVTESTYGTVYSGLPEPAGTTWIPKCTSIVKEWHPED